MTPNLPSPTACAKAKTSALFVLTTSFASLWGCADVAGLEEHKPYPGFPDSSSVPCSNGGMIVNCEDVRQTAPQDGHTLVARPAYETSGSDVIDRVTGLSWYKTPGGPVAYEEAVTYCDVLAGDYRLPTRIELASLLDFRADGDVRIDTQFFSTVLPQRYWSSSQYATDVNEYWTVDFTAAITSQYVVLGSHVTSKLGVLCVKSAEGPYEPGPFIVAGVEDRFLLDTHTGLMWMNKPLQSTKNWVESLNACATAQDGGYGDFRMPNIKELSTIVDESKVGTMAAAIRDPFEVEYNKILWSSTPSPTGATIFALNATGGSIGQQLASYTYIGTLCVRGPD